MPPPTHDCQISCLACGIRLACHSLSREIGSASRKGRTPRTQQGDYVFSPRPAATANLRQAQRDGARRPGGFQGCALGLLGRACGERAVVRALALGGYSAFLRARLCLSPGLRAGGFDWAGSWATATGRTRTDNLRFTNGRREPSTPRHDSARADSAPTVPRRDRIFNVRAETVSARTKAMVDQAGSGISACTAGTDSRLCHCLPFVKPRYRLDLGKQGRVDRVGDGPLILDRLTLYAEHGRYTVDERGVANNAQPMV